MKIFQVGGSLRDEMLGLPVNDRDWVVVGSTPQEMIKLGYRPIGKDFPVFLHPKPTKNTLWPGLSAKPPQATAVLLSCRPFNYPGTGSATP